MVVDEDGERRGGTVGFPLPGVGLRVQDDAGQPLPTGEIGGIQVRGPNVFAGYWRMPEKTAEEFTADGWFKTGDVGMQDERGYFSDGIVNRFLARHSRRDTNAPPVTRLNVTTDWAPGSSGSAVLDEFGNAIGHVTTITTLPGGNGKAADTDKGKGREPTLITLHEAVSAKDVLALIQKPGKSGAR